MITKSKLRTSLIAVLVLLSSSFVFGAGAFIQQTKPVQPTAESVRAAVEEFFEATAEPVAGFNPYFVRGDFNGDGAGDVLIVVRLKRGRGALPKDVKTTNPFGYGPKPEPLPVAANAPTLALAVIHGNKAGWQTSPAVGKFILLGDSPVLILQEDRLSDPGAEKHLMSLQKKRGRRARADDWPPAAARGDGIVVETEATESILYWDGRTYRWKEAAGGE